MDYYCVLVVGVQNEQVQARAIDVQKQVEKDKSHLGFRRDRCRICFVVIRLQVYAKYVHRHLQEDLGAPRYRVNRHHDLVGADANLLDRLCVFVEVVGACERHEGHGDGPEDAEGWIEGQDGVVLALDAESDYDIDKREQGDTAQSKYFHTAQPLLTAFHSFEILVAIQILAERLESSAKQASCLQVHIAIEPVQAKPHVHNERYPHSRCLREHIPAEGIVQEIEDVAGEADGVPEEGNFHTQTHVLQGAALHR